MTNFSGVTGVKCLPFLGAVGIICLGLSTPAAAQSGSKMITTLSFGAQQDIETRVASFFHLDHTGPVPEYVPIPEMQRRSLPHVQSSEMFPFYYMHIYSRTFGPDPNLTPPFDGFEEGEEYRAKIERWNDAIGENGDYEFVENVDWTQPLEDP